MNTHRSALRLQLGLVLLLLLSLALTACNFKSRSPNEVVYWTVDTGELGIKAQRQLVDAFNKANPDVHVKLVPVTGSSVTDITSVLTAVRGGTGPDIYFMDRFTISQHAAIGLLTDLDPFIKKEGIDLEKQFLPFAWEETLYKGHPYALPVAIDNRSLFYNKDVMREAGVDPAILDPKNGPITLKQLEEISFKINKLNDRGSFDRLGFIPWTDQAFHTTWGFIHGAKFFDPKTCQLTPTEPAMVDAYQFLSDWATKMTKEKVDTFYATFQPANAPAAQNAFYSGNLAMMINGNWTLESIGKYAPKMDYGVTYLPVINKGDQPVTWAGGWSLVMPKGAQNPDGAYRFMRYFTGEEGQRVYAKITSQLPAWSSLYNDDSLFPGNLKFFADQIPNTKIRVPLPVAGQLFDELGAAQDEVIFHTSTPEQALQKVFNRVQPQLQQYCPL